MMCGKFDESYEYYVNCGHTIEMKVWSSQLWLRFTQWELSPKNVFGASTGFEPMASALALQFSTNLAIKTHTLGAGQFVEFIVPVKGMKHEYYVNCGHTNEMKVWSSQLWLRFTQWELSPKNVFGASTGFEPMASALALQCSANWKLHPWKEWNNCDDHTFISFDESVDHIRSASPEVAKTEYIQRHDNAASYIKLNVCQSYNIKTIDKWYEHKLEAVAENEQVTVL